MSEALRDVLTAKLAARLRAAGLDPQQVIQIAAAALAEDLAGGTDVTTNATVPAEACGTARLVARQDGVIAGLPVAETVFRVAAHRAGATAPDRPRAGGQHRVKDAGTGAERLAQPHPANPGGRPPGTPRAAHGAAPLLPARQVPAHTRQPLRITYHAADGGRVSSGETVLTVSGPVRVLLTAERTALNLLCHLSGIATLTRRWVDAVVGTGAAIRDTRKTLPGLRALEKYAVRQGGGVNHRMSLSDAALVKDNHVAAAGSLIAAFAAVSRAAPGLPIEVECDTLTQVKEAVEAGATLILLDNFETAQMAAAVAYVAGRALVEASGGLSLVRARAAAATGVDFLAVGALTHSAPALDIALDIAADMASDLAPGDARQ